MSPEPAPPPEESPEPVEPETKPPPKIDIETDGDNPYKDNSPNPSPGGDSGDQATGTPPDPPYSPTSKP